MHLPTFQRVSTIHLAGVGYLSAGTLELPGPGAAAATAVLSTFTRPACLTLYCPRIVGMYGRAVAMRPVDEAHALVAEHERICKAELEAAAHEQADTVSVRGTP